MVIACWHVFCWCRFFAQLSPAPTILIDLPRRTWKPCCKLISKYIRHKKTQKPRGFLYVMNKPWVCWVVITRIDPYLTWMCIEEATTHCSSIFTSLNWTHNFKGSSNTACDVHLVPKHELLCMVIVNHPYHSTQHEELLLVPFDTPRIPNLVNMYICLGNYVSLCRSFVDGLNIILHPGIILYVYEMHSPSTPSLVVSS